MLRAQAPTGPPSAVDPAAAMSRSSDTPRGSSPSSSLLKLRRSALSPLAPGPSGPPRSSAPPRRSDQGLSADPCELWDGVAAEAGPMETGPSRATSGDGAGTVSGATRTASPRSPSLARPAPARAGSAGAETACQTSGSGSVGARIACSRANVALGRRGQVWGARATLPCGEAPRPVGHSGWKGFSAAATVWGHSPSSADARKTRRSRPRAPDPRRSAAVDGRWLALGRSGAGTWNSSPGSVRQAPPSAAADRTRRYASAHTSGSCSGGPRARGPTRPDPPMEELELAVEPEPEPSEPERDPLLRP